MCRNNNLLNVLAQKCWQLLYNSVLLIQDLDQETLAHVDTDNRRQTLEEQTEFLKSVHDKV